MLFKGLAKRSTLLGLLLLSATAAYPLFYSSPVSSAQFPVSFFNNSWPFGKDGALVILSGNVFLNPGDVKDYSSVNIHAGANLVVLGGTGTPVILGCKGLFTNNGAILFQNVSANGTFSKTAPDGFLMSYSVQANSGGFGGGNSNTSGGNATGPQGGGGAGEQGGEDGGISQGGNGGQGDDSGGPFQGGSGATSFTFPNAGSGSDASGSAFDGNTYASGGGGGFQGYNGGGLYIKAAGGCAGTGQIGADGQDGGQGGSGGNADGVGSSINVYGGGGGGGGGGGSGGKIVIHYRGAAPLWSLSASAAFGGGGGSGGFGVNFTDNGFDGDSGTDGSVGVNGSASATTY